MAEVANTGEDYALKEVNFRILFGRWRWREVSWENYLCILEIRRLLDPYDLEADFLDRIDK